MGLRRKSRELIIQTMYALSYQETDQYLQHLDHLSKYRDILIDITQEDEIEPDNTIFEFADNLLRNLLPKIEEIDTIISRNIGEYKIDKIGQLDLYIIRLACYELIYENLPPAVAINEAIDLAKKFSAEKSPALINAILDKIKKEELNQNEE